MDACARPQLWDLRRLERDVSFHSRLTYKAHSGRVTALCCLAAGGAGGDASGGGGPGRDATVASASSTGSLHLWRPELVSRAPGAPPDKYTGGGGPA